MKSHRQPLSESFVYSSPERPIGGSFRWIGPGYTKGSPPRRRAREAGYARRRKT